MCSLQKAPERFNGCLQQIRKTITKIHIKFIVVSLSLTTAIFFLRYFVRSVYVQDILMFALYRQCDLMDFSDEMFFSNFAIFLRPFFCRKQSSQLSSVKKIFCPFLTQNRNRDLDPNLKTVLVKFK
jgi:hypothetical protein